MLYHPPSFLSSFFLRQLHVKKREEKTLALWQYRRIVPFEIGVHFMHSLVVVVFLLFIIIFGHCSRHLYVRPSVYSIHTTSAISKKSKVSAPQRLHHRPMAENETAAVPTRARLIIKSHWLKLCAKGEQQKAEEQPMKMEIFTAAITAAAAAAAAATAK